MKLKISKTFELSRKLNYSFIDGKYYLLQNITIREFNGFCKNISRQTGVEINQNENTI
jgi:hypothetical protein